MQNTQEVLIIIIVLLILFLFLGFFILMILVRHRTQKKKSEIEKERMKADFNQQLSLTKLEIQDEIFNTISQEIHDNVGQIFSLVKMQLNVMLESNKWSVKELEEIRENASRGMSELRSIAKNLNSDWMENLNLEDSINREIDYMNKSTNIHFFLSVNGAMELPNKTRIILFRIVQEACQNIIKHANAKVAAIRIYYANASFRLEIEDDGIGFDPDKSTNGIGLKNIRKRSSLIGATLNIQSTIDSGSIIYLNISNIL